MRSKSTLAAVAAVAVFLAIGSDALGAPINFKATASVISFAGDEATEFYGGGIATVNGSSMVTPDHLDEIRFAAHRGGVRGDNTFLVTDPEMAGYGLAAIRFRNVENLTGAVPGSFPLANLPGEIPVRGLVQLCLLSSACTSWAGMAMTVPTTVNGIAGGDVKGIGIGGMLTIGGFGGIRISVQAAPWTIKTAFGQGLVTTPSGAQIDTTFTVRGWAHGPASESTSTFAADGVVQLVTPNRVETNMPLGLGHPDGRLGRFVPIVVARIRFIPEPGLLLLLGSGVGGLAILGRIRG